LGTHWITCRARWTTTACRNYAGSTTAANLAEARADLAAWIAQWQTKYPRLVAWVEENIEETLTFCRLPRRHHKHLKSTNMLERLSEETKHRTHVVRIAVGARVPG
jgi:transposase-like protein